MGPVGDLIYQWDLKPIYRGWWYWDLIFTPIYFGTIPWVETTKQGLAPGLSLEDEVGEQIPLLSKSGNPPGNGRTAFWSGDLEMNQGIFHRHVCLPEIKPTMAMIIHDSVYGHWVRLKQNSRCPPTLDGLTMMGSKSTKHINIQTMIYLTCQHGFVLVVIVSLKSVSSNLLRLFRFRNGGEGRSGRERQTFVLRTLDRSTKRCCVTAVFLWTPVQYWLI